MTKKDYIRILECELSKIPSEDLQDVIREVDTHFIEAMKQNRSEENIVKALGSPVTMAQSILLEYDIKQERNFIPFRDNLSIGLRIVGIGFKNILLLPLFFAVALLVLSMYLVAFSFYFASSLIIISPIINFVSPTLVSTGGFPVLLLPLVGIIMFLITKKMHGGLSTLSKKLYTYLIKYFKVDYKKILA